MNKDQKKLLSILKDELAPAQGCTEPIAVAYATARASSEINSKAEKIVIRVDPNIYKNGSRVGIPGTDETGLYIAAALGYLCGDASRKLEVIEGANQQDIKQARQMVDDNKVIIKMVPQLDRLFIESKIVTKDRQAQAVILDKHLNIVNVEKGSDLGPYQVESDIDSPPHPIQQYSLPDILDFVNNIDISQLQFLQEGIKLSRKIASEGLEQNGFFAYSLQEMVEDGLEKDNPINRAQRMCAAASEARMSGSKNAVMSNSGSGNQGITAFLTVIGAAEAERIEGEKLLRSLALSNLITIYIKSHLDVLSPMCGAGIAAGTGGSCGVAYLLGGQKEEIIKSTRNMLGVLTGMICDGAKIGCAYKVGLAARWAVRSALLAIRGVSIPENNGILTDDFVQMIKNLSEVNKPGMSETDPAIVNIMKSSE